MSTTAAGEAVAALGRVLRKRGVAWYLFGAQAVIYWGRPRLSADVDITVLLPIGEARGLAAALREAGFSPLVEEVEEFVERTRVLPLVWSFRSLLRFLHGAPDTAPPPEDAR